MAVVKNVANKNVFCYRTMDCFYVRYQEKKVFLHPDTYETKASKKNIHNLC